MFFFLNVCKPTPSTALNKVVPSSCSDFCRIFTACNFFRDCFMKYFLGLVFFLLVTQCSFAQDDLFGTPKAESHKGLLIGFNADFDIPAADMAKRFGNNYRIGPSLQYKTKSNWIFGVKGDFIFGNKIRQDSFLANFYNADGSLIGTDGFRASTRVYERGYLIGLQGGKIFNISKKNSDNGILVMATAGFIQHKILINNPNGNLPQFSGEYRKGYDRLTNGLFVEPYVGYVYFSKNGLLNFHIGLDVMAGFTQGRRDYLFDVQKPGNDKRLDILFGIRGGWYIQVFKRKSEEYFF
jgi:hypothetical protein